MAHIESAKNRRDRVSVALVVVCVLGLTLAVFARALSGGQNFAYRDTANYYFPLYRLVQAEWAAGRIPLWNPYEGIGVPLAADPTAGVFYPGKLIFVLPIPFAWSFKLYVVGHVLLAAWTAFRFNRYVGASAKSGALGGLAYAFSGAVLSQYANVVYLVGAAWLPAAALAADWTLRTGRFGAAILFGAVLALMIIGGDPHMAYHVVLLAILYAILRPAAKERPASAPSGLPPPASRLPPRLLLLLAGVACGAAFSSVQLLPSIGWTRSTDRVVYTRPRSVFELPGYVETNVDARENRDPRPWYGGLLAQRAPEGTHEARIYRYSVGPWRWAEFLWPNVSGRQYPIHRRWVDAIPAEGRVWVPSLYLGLLPFVLALSVWRLRGADVRVRWLSWCAVVGLLASLGSYGLGWLAHETAAMWHALPIGDVAGGAINRAQDAAARPLVGDAFGGLYWFFVTFLPGYAYFRYPGKWLLVAAWAISTLAAIGWQRMTPSSAAAICRWLKRLVILSAVAAVAALVIRPMWDNWLAGQPPHPLFGPLDVFGAWADFCSAFVQTAAVGTCAWWVVKRREENSDTGNGRLATLALLLVVVDLAIAQRWIVQTAPASAWQANDGVLWAIDQRQRNEQSGQAAEPSYRIYRARPWLPAAWARTSSANRLAEAVRWQNESLGPKHNLLSEQPLITTHGSMMNRELKDFLTTEEIGDIDRSLLRALNTRYLVLPSEDVAPDGGADDVPYAKVVEITGVFRRAWIVHRWEVGPGNETSRLDFAKEALVANDPRPKATPNAASSKSEYTKAPDGSSEIKRTPNSTCRVVHYEPQHVEIAASLARPGLLILADQYDPAWRAEVTTTGEPSPREVPVVRTNHVMRGVWLPAGEHRVVFRYRSRLIAAGASISAASWLAWFVYGGLVWRRQRKRRVVT